MNKRRFALGTLIVFVLFLIDCATTETYQEQSVLNNAPSGKLMPREFQEIRLVTSAGETYQGKLTGFEGDTVILLPYPYWNVEPLKINLSEIHVIQTEKKGGGAGKGFLNGLAWTYIICGILSGVSSQYNTDYQLALAGSAALGLIGGLIGLAVGGISDAAAKTQYEFYGMSRVEKIAAIRKLMGL